MEELFQQKTFGWQELAILYAPGLTPHSASRRLTRWVIINKELYDRLILVSFTGRNYCGFSGRTMMFAYVKKTIVFDFENNCLYLQIQLFL